MIARPWPPTSGHHKEVENYPLDVLGAHTEGMIDCMIEQALGCLLPFDLSQKAG